VSLPPPRRTHFAIDGHGRLRVCGPWPHDDDDGRQSEAILEARLDAIAASGAPSLTQRARDTTDALLSVLRLLNVPSDKGLQLVNNEALWKAFLDAHPAPVFEYDTTEGFPAQAPRFKGPINRKVCAALMAALLELGLPRTARQLLDGCPKDADQRVVLKRLLNMPQPPGGPLVRLNQPDLITDFDERLRRMLAWTNRQGERPYRRLRDPIDALRMQWHPPQDRNDIKHLLAARGWRISIDAVTGAERLSAAKPHATLTPFVIDLLVAYFKLTPPTPASGAAAFGVLWDALRQWGVDLGDGSVLEPGKAADVKTVQAQIDALGPTGREALADLVRRSCAALFATGHEAGLRGLIGLSLLLKDPTLSTHADFRQGAAAAVKGHGLAGLWILSQSPTPKNTLDIVLSLKEWLPGIESPRAALRCIQDVMAFLARLHGHRTRSGEAWQDTWPVARSHLLLGMLNAFTRLIERGAQADDPDWVRLAQWVWVTGATLNLLSPGLFDKPAVERLGVLQANDQRLNSTALKLAPCLNLLDRLDGLFHHTLVQLCSPAVLELPEPMLRDEEVQIKSLFIECPTDIRHAVLRLPLAAIWPFLPPSLTIKDFLMDLQASPDQALELLLQLKERDDLVPNLWEFAMIERLHEPAFVRVTDARPADVTMAQWVIGTLNLLRDRLTVTRQPAGLPHLLGCFQRVTLAATEQQREAYWHNWIDFTFHFLQANSNDPNACLLMGTYLPLGPSPLASVAQIVALALALDKPLIAYLLIGWLRQEKFDQAIKQVPENEASREQLWLFLGVAQVAQRYVEQLPRDEKKWFRAELKSMKQQCEQALSSL
jgi:hypothetical protein